VRRIRTHGATHVADRGGARAVGVWRAAGAHARPVIERRLSGARD
jgi:hypothetical protein